MHAIAGRVKEDPKLKLYGQRYLNGEPVTGDSLIPAAFIEQEVNFFPHMTVRETLNFRVELKLGSRLSKKGRDQVVEELLDQLGLTGSADTIVGNAKVRGISGGERKRLSIAVEMINSPALIFLDEPTSGLDSTAASKLVETLHELATVHGKTIIAVIHQPNQHVFSKFDDLLLVSEGKQLYFGERQHVRSYMEEQGLIPMRETGTAEHILDCITPDPFPGETEEQAESRIEGLAAAAKAKHINLGIKGEMKSKHVRHLARSDHGPRANIFVQLKLLLNRSFREVFRSKTTLIVKTVQQVTLGFIYGGIYSLGRDQASIQDRFGLLSLIAIGSANVSDHVVVLFGS